MVEGSAVGLPAHNRRSAIDPSGLKMSSSTDKTNALGGQDNLNASSIDGGDANGRGESEAEGVEGPPSPLHLAPTSPNPSEPDQTPRARPTPANRTKHLA